MNATTKAKYIKTLGKLKTAFHALDDAAHTLHEESDAYRPVILARVNVGEALNTVTRTLGRKLK